MKRPVVALIGSLALAATALIALGCSPSPAAAPALASAQPAAETPGSPSEVYLALLEEYQPARRAAEQAILEALASKTVEEQVKAYEGFFRLETTYVSRYFEIARKYPRDPVALDTLTWLMTSGLNTPESEKAAEILIRDHIQGDKLISVYPQLSSPFCLWSTGAERVLRAAVDRALSRGTRGQACLDLARHLNLRACAIRELAWPDCSLPARLTAKAWRRMPAQPSGADDADSLAKEAEQLFARVVEQYADLPGDRGTMGKVAQDELFKLRDLGIGSAGPEIEGKDVDGTAFRLSDYRGKVVVLTFSGNWCGPCRALYPHERMLVERLKGRPFALVSVNTDSDKETLRKSTSSGEISWRCWWEGGASWPNCARWRVSQFPTIYVLDGKGKIRAKDVKGQALDDAVNRLLMEMEAP
jgi:thiol-disulfide isomerase/thioredoxin